ncbi:hypothetical protein L218DRAFT_284 [Marasmius fiardii PR-910]|nr:hypothetical protein L218DRAFT_284 [Marasmius fiardii PR-910]
MSSLSFIIGASFLTPAAYPGGPSWIGIRICCVRHRSEGQIRVGRPSPVKRSNASFRIDFGKIGDIRRFLITWNRIQKLGTVEHALIP